MMHNVPPAPGTGHAPRGLGPRKARSAIGRAARRLVPADEHAAIGSAKRDPVSILERQAESRLPELIALRYERMAASPFAFYRGAAAIMADDLAQVANSRIETQLCGDAHLANVGVYASPERRLVMDLNDFDETSVGPFEWDVKRMATSFEIATRENGFDDAERRGVVLGFLRAYAESVRRAARMPVLELFQAHVELGRTFEELSGRLGTDAASRMSEGMSKARKRDSRHAARSLTEHTTDGERFRSDPPTLVPVRDLVERGDMDAREAEDRLAAVLAEYEASLPDHRRRIIARYRMVDAALKIVGVGSVGTRAWVMLLRGNGKRDLLVLQMKEAQRSVLEANDGPSAHPHQGRRVIDGQRIMQALSDVMLGWTSGFGTDDRVHDFYVRQFRDMKASFAPDLMDPTVFGIFADSCAGVLARAHARGGDAAVISGYLGKGRSFAEAVAAFASAYADRNEDDHRALVGAIASGRVPARGAGSLEGKVLP